MLLSEVPSGSPDADGCLFVFSSHLCRVIHLRCEFIVAAGCQVMHSPPTSFKDPEDRHHRGDGGGKKTLNGAPSPSACPHLAKDEAASAILARQRTVYPGRKQHLCRDAAVTVTYLH